MFDYPEKIVVLIECPRGCGKRMDRILTGIERETKDMGCSFDVAVFAGKNYCPVKSDRISESLSK